VTLLIACLMSAGMSILLLWMSLLLQVVGIKSAAAVRPALGAESIEARPA
jgi:hypothetical protein